MTDGIRKSHLRKAPQIGLSEVGLPEGNPSSNSLRDRWPMAIHNIIVNIIIVIVVKDIIIILIFKLSWGR